MVERRIARMDEEAQANDGKESAEAGLGGRRAKYG